MKKGQGATTTFIVLKYNNGLVENLYNFLNMLNRVTILAFLSIFNARKTK